MKTKVCPEYRRYWITKIKHVSHSHNSRKTPRDRQIGILPWRGNQAPEENVDDAIGHRAKTTKIGGGGVKEIFKERDLAKLKVNLGQIVGLEARVSGEA